MKLLKSRSLWAVAILLFLAYMVFALMPKPISMNLDSIGAGKESVVFIYDLNFTVSNKQSTEFNRAKETLGESINFLVAKQGDPTSASFRERYSARSTELLFFDDSGDLIARRPAPVSSEELIAFAKRKN